MNLCVRREAGIRTDSLNYIQAGKKGNQTFFFFNVARFMQEVDVARCTSLL